MRESLNTLYKFKWLEDAIKGGKEIDKGSLQYRLFIKPHWFSKFVMIIRNKMPTESMILMGEEILVQREKKLNKAVRNL